jgi:hypothetical protein
MGRSGTPDRRWGGGWEIGSLHRSSYLLKLLHVEKLGRLLGLQGAVRKLQGDPKKCEQKIIIETLTKSHLGPI